MSEEFKFRKDVVLVLCVLILIVAIVVAMAYLPITAQWTVAYGILALFFIMLIVVVWLKVVKPHKRSKMS